MAENIQLDRQKTTEKPLIFSSLLKPVKEYNFASFKKSGDWSIIKSKLLKDESIISTNKIKEYKQFLADNYIFGNVVDIYKKFTKDEKLIEGLLLLLMANAYSSFSDKSKFNILVANQKLNELIEQKYVSKEFIKEIEQYSKKYSLDDFDHFSFKNLSDYEFLSNWKKINAIIVHYFKQINLEKLGKLIASEFLLTYETHREAKDFVSSSLIQHEHLAEDYSFTKINDLLESIFNELVEMNTEQILIQEIIFLLLKKSLTYQVQTKKKSLWTKFLENRRSKEKFRLYCSEEINDTIAKEFRLLTHPHILEKPEEKLPENKEKFVHYNTIKINGKKVKVDPESLKYAKFIFKNKDKIDFQASLSETYFRSKHLSFNKYSKHLLIIKLSSLAYLYPLKINEQKIDFNKAKQLFEQLITKTAFEISEEFGNNLSNILKSEDTLKNEVFTKLGLDKLDRYKLWSKYVAVNKAIYKDLKLNTKITEASVIYEILKNEVFAFETFKKSHSILSNSEISYNDISKYQSELIAEIEKDLKKERNNAYVKYVRFLTETFGKLHLSDKPPLSIYGKIGLGFTYLILIMWALLIIVPIMQVVLQTFNYWSSNDATSQGSKIGTEGRFDFQRFAFGFNNFVFLFTRTKFIYWTINSIVIATVTMIVMVFVTAMIGYAFSRFRFKGKRISLMSVMLIQMVPTVSSFIVFYILFQVLNKHFGVPGQVMITFIYIGGGIPGNVFVLKGYLDNISTDIDDAAKIDGCSTWTVFTRIIVPLAKPMLSVIALWSFIGPFGDVLLPKLLLNDQEEWTMATGLNSLLGQSSFIAQGAFAAGSLLVAVPISTLFIMLQGNITGGLSGGVKG
ncbi:sugar ABC transporter permease [Mycoplasma feriruminatoris]|uniref:sugar ABC transporter permease n=1 Tax=Mycoplasma feriruminatoris TaxID=1179777 RepID=UPI0002A4EF9A|nr:sugar ABC transporter permease [Mycoplasma feriruminatoris]UKS54362.1 binding--dependent transport system innermembrane component family protein [Mycoplasma feriruminatoris]